MVQIKQGASYNAAALAEQHRDHAWFISFAPVQNPKIAIAVLLENGGWGANAAPIARQLSDFYLLQLQGEKGSELPLPKPTVASASPMSQSDDTGLPSQAGRIEAAYRSLAANPAALPASESSRP